jgi:hypothetical protein
MNYEKKIREYLNSSEVDQLYKNMLLNLFPELKEPKEVKADNINCVPNKKFKVGDFIINDYCFGKVIALTDDAYLLDTGQGIPFSCEHNARLWTIDDAKPGDVLSYKDGEWIFLYKGRKDESLIEYYALTSERVLIINSVGLFDLTSCIIPAIKEQRNLLFKKIKEAGWEWDAEELELKLVEEN